MLTKEYLEGIAKFPKGRRKREFARIASAEWKSCSDDIFYWLDPAKHEVLGNYVYTRDGHPMYTCIKCGSGSATYTLSNCEKHMKLRHNIEVTSENELRGYFIELSTTRPFPIDMPYVRPVVEHWLRKPIVLLEKSRDMVATWITDRKSV